MTQHAGPPAEAVHVDDPNGLIFGPAIKRGTTVYALPKPARHPDLLAKLKANGFNSKKTDVEGFKTKDGEFLDRVQAAQALNALPAVGALHTENLW